MVSRCFQERERMQSSFDGLQQRVTKQLEEVGWQNEYLEAALKG